MCVIETLAILVIVYKPKLVQQTAEHINTSAIFVIIMIVIVVSMALFKNKMIAPMAVTKIAHIQSHIVNAQIAALAISIIVLAVIVINVITPHLPMAQEQNK